MDEITKDTVIDVPKVKEKYSISKVYGIYWNVLEVYFSVFGFVTHVAGVIVLIALIIKSIMGVMQQ